jgi:hypothetical protein
MRCHHYCNDPVGCPACLQLFYRWAERHTNGRPSKRRKDGISFYDHVLPLKAKEP